MFIERNRLREIIGPRRRDGVVGHFLDDHVGTRRIGEVGDDPRCVVNGKDLIDRVVIVIAIEFLDQGRTVVEVELPRTVGIEINLIAMTRAYFIFESLPFLVACAVGAAADILLTAPMTHKRTIGVLLLFLAAGT